MQEEGERRGGGKRKSVFWLGAPRPPCGPRGLSKPPHGAGTSEAAEAAPGGGPHCRAAPKPGQSGHSAR